MCRRCHCYPILSEVLRDSSESELEEFSESQHMSAELAPCAAVVGKMESVVATSLWLCEAQPRPVGVVGPCFHDQEDLFSSAGQEAILISFLCHREWPRRLVWSLWIPQNTGQWPVRCLLEQKGRDVLL